MTADVVVLGVVDRPVCGIREQGRALASELSRQGAVVEERWVERTGPGLGAALRVGRQVRAAARESAPSTVIWNYAPGPFGHRGVPLTGVLAGWAARRRGARVVTIAHELAVDRSSSPRMLALGLLQRLGLAVVLHGSDVVVVSTEERAARLARHPLLRRPPVVVPVTANVIPGDGDEGRSHDGFVVGVFGHGTEDVRADVLLDAVVTLVPDLDVRVRLIGAPGATATWTEAAATRGLTDRVSASGPVPPRELTSELLGVDVVAHLNAEGPTTRKTTLAAALAHGRPVVALDGAKTAALYLDAPAVALVGDARALAAELAELAGDPDGRRARGVAAATLYRDHLDVRHVAAEVHRAAVPSHRVLLVVNRGGNMERRAHALADRLGPPWEATVVSGRVDLAAIRAADLVYVMDPGKVGFPAALVGRALRRPVVVEVGDHQAALYRRQGRTWPAVAAGGLIDRIVARHATGVVVRGRRLAADLDVRVPWVEVPDGVDLEQFRPASGDEVRARLGIPEGTLVLGIVGALGAAPDGTSTYGWDLVEALALLPGEPVWGLIVGDGPGRGWLERRATELGVADRLVLAGRIPHDEVPAHLGAIDLCISTQSNDVVGRGRTTAKLPEYLACDRFVLATAVGGAADVLPSEMLLDHHGLRDPAHPARLAQRSRELLPDRAGLRSGAGTRPIAEANFDYTRLAARLGEFLREVGG